jgi:hypothetical protein
LRNLINDKKDPLPTINQAISSIADKLTEIKSNPDKINERVEVMNKRDDAEPDYQYRNILKVQPYLDSNDDSEHYVQVIGFFTDDNDKIEKYHVRTFSTNDVNSRTSLSEWTPEDFKKYKAVKVDDNDSEIANTIKKHPKYVKY